MKPVCVLGNGQLGRMLRQAGEPLGIAVYPVGIDAEPEAVPYQNSVITAEIERWPETALTRELATHSAFVNRDIFPRLADRLTQNSCSTSSAWRPRRGSCWRAPPNGRRYSLRWASWRSSNAGSAAMTAAANGACARARKPNCRPMPMASASSSKASISPAKCRWCARPRRPFGILPADPQPA